MAKHLFIPHLRSIDIRCDGNNVQILERGRLLIELPWKAADALAQAISAKARQAEELDKAQSIALDQALLLRAGVPIGLTNHPRIKAEAAKEAAWNRKLRRALPGGVKSMEHVGTPNVVKHDPTKAGT